MNWKENWNPESAANYFLKSFELKDALKIFTYIVS